MSLTAQGLANRKWGSLPELRKVFEDVRVSDHHYGFSSTKYNQFAQLSDLIEIALVVLDHREELANSKLTQEDVAKELLRLGTRLNDTSNYFPQLSEEIRRIQLDPQIKGDK